MIERHGDRVDVPREQTYARRNRNKREDRNRQAFTRGEARADPLGRGKPAMAQARHNAREQEENAEEKPIEVSQNCVSEREQNVVHALENERRAKQAGMAAKMRKRSAAYPECSGACRRTFVLTEASAGQLADFATCAGAGTVAVEAVAARV